jgi:predicted pyridoxine 5'-phosphate oxidase superfamily flavin-nucleotide-binding protein
MAIPNEVKNLFEKQPIVTFSTSDKQGNPNVVPIFWKKILNEEAILLVDNFMKMSKENLLGNSSVCLAFWDSETHEAYKVKGKALYHTEGPVYELGKSFIRSKKPEATPKGIVEIKVTEVYDITPGSDAGKKMC